MKVYICDFVRCVCGFLSPHTLPLYHKVSLPCLFIAILVFLLWLLRWEKTKIDREREREKFNHLLKEKQKDRNNKQEQIWCINVEWIYRMCHWQSNDQCQILYIIQTLSFIIIIIEREQKRPREEYNSNNRNTYHVTFCINYFQIKENQSQSLKCVCVLFLRCVECSWIYIKIHSKYTHHWKMTI